MRHGIAGPNPRKRLARGIQIGGFTDLLIGKPLAADRHVGLAEDRGDAGLRDVVVIADLLGVLADFVSLHDVGDV